MGDIITYANWDKRPNDQKKQEEPYKKYFFICEGTNTEKFYFTHLIDNRNNPNVNPIVDFGLWEKVGKAKNFSNPRKMLEFVNKEKHKPDNGFDNKRDKIVIVFDADIYEKKHNSVYDNLIIDMERDDIIPAVTNPCFELFLLLHIKRSYRKYIRGNEEKFLKKDRKIKHGWAYQVLRELTGINAKTNPEIGYLADNISTAIEQEKLVNQDIYKVKGKVSSNVGAIIKRIVEEKPDI